jgi:hypothetical protein
VPAQRCAAPLPVGETGGSKGKGGDQGGDHPACTTPDDDPGPEGRGYPGRPSGEGPRSLPPREGGAPLDGSALGQRQRLASRLASSEAFEFRLGEIDGLLDRFALLRAYGDHFADRALCGHLRADAGRRRITGKQGRHILARRVIVEGNQQNTGRNSYLARAGRSVQSRNKRHAQLA